MRDLTPPFSLALDQGSHASKALIFDARGRLAGAGECAIATRRPRPGWVEHDAGEILASLRQAIADARAASGLATLEFSAAGLAVQRSSIVCWDRHDGVPLSPVLSWQDRRNAAWLAQQHLDPDRLRAITGLVASPHYGASKLRWCLDHLPQVRQAERAGRLCCGPLASFLLHQLLDERPFLVDPANAARTLLYDLGAGDWSPPMLERCGLRRDCLPHCVPNRHPFGTLRQEGVEAGLVAATGDQPAALFAWGEPGADTLFVNIGTGAFVQRLFPEKPPAAPGLLQGVAWQDAARSRWVLEGTDNGAGAALDWLAGARDAAVQRLVEAAPRWLAQAEDPLLFSNGVGGLGSPYWIADAPIRFSREAELPGETVAVLESIVFLLQVNIQAITATVVPGYPPARRIVISGGLAQLDGLCQRLADLSGLPVERPPDVEATAHGLGWLLNGALCPHAAEARFLPADADALQRRFRQWRQWIG